jgi:hypothetical protein
VPINRNSIRWTNGDAAIPAGLFSSVSGGCVMIVDVARAAQYGDDGEHRRAA